VDKTKKTWLLVIAVSLIVIASSATVIFNSSPNPKRISYQLPDTEIDEKYWKEIMNSDALIDQFKILNTGSVKVPLDGMLNTDKLEEDHSFREYVWVDVFVFMFHHQDKGWYIIDTGLDSTFQQNGNIKGLLADNFIKASRQEKDQNIAAQIERTGNEINGIFFTHLHGDHTAGLPELDPTLSKYIGKDEEIVDMPLLYHTNHFNDDIRLIEMDWSKGIAKPPFEHLMDIFGDGSLLGIHTPGHSNGHLSYLLMSSEGPILLTGDASHTKYGFENSIEPGWVEDRSAAENSLSQLVKFHRMFPKVDIIYGHEQ
jgi:glyoxylase-like metal-dependent hydrolase (beta-lactamase superfamily II)